MNITISASASPAPSLPDVPPIWNVTLGGTATNNSVAAIQFNGATVNLGGGSPQLPQQVYTPTMVFVILNPGQSVAVHGVATEQILSQNQPTISSVTEPVELAVRVSLFRLSRRNRLIASDAGGSEYPWVRPITTASCLRCRVMTGDHFLGKNG